MPSQHLIHQRKSGNRLLFIIERKKFLRLANSLKFTEKNVFRHHPEAFTIKRFTAVIDSVPQ
jgi:hypothetical protein